VRLQCGYSEDMKTNLTPAQRTALELIDAANGGSIRGTIATSTRRWLEANGLITSGLPVFITDAGLSALRG
jgi:hypothetical protein